ncbi:hypothetical protein P175DRAFT_0528801 [Aspergillus ochraceoroseus IBT 24754]|uniref:Uncharacterized protein n=1 Tax=Aspergillus ochraceoroseus IBT 24754 TaxID=1392256 RepID=A0A2T5M9P5_9EURO|nr:uncharacterized protein P175DRAFT_0528801 [Aspergillus ochraceoroseus IBT 24754]PTU25262.1 hypothetical protein P175DRAFT_0528801 [Aspergillus ochraceoroseus IBT 24754]
MRGEKDEDDDDDDWRVAVTTETLLYPTRTSKPEDAKDCPRAPKIKLSDSDREPPESASNCDDHEAFCFLLCCHPIRLAPSSPLVPPLEPTRQWVSYLSTSSSSSLFLETLTGFQTTRLNMDYRGELSPAEATRLSHPIGMPYLKQRDTGQEFAIQIPSQS